MAGKPLEPIWKRDYDDVNSLSKLLDGVNEKAYYVSMYYPEHYFGYFNLLKLTFRNVRSLLKRMHKNDIISEIEDHIDKLKDHVLRIDRNLVLLSDKKKARYLVLVSSDLGNLHDQVLTALSEVKLLWRTMVTDSPGITGFDRIKAASRGKK